MEDWNTPMPQTDEELEGAFDAMVLSVGDRILKEEGETALLNFRRMEEMRFCYSVLAFLTSGTDASLSYKLHQPFQSMGSISAEGERLEFLSPKWVSRIMEFADNMEVYPITGKRIRLTFTFHGLTKPAAKGGEV